MPIFLIIQQQFSTTHFLFTHFQFWSRFIYFRESLILKYICSVFPIKLEKNDSFQRPRKSYRFCGLLWLIFGLLRDLFQVKCSKERIEIPPKYFQNYQFAVICTGCRRANFSKNDRGFHTLAIFVHEIAPMRAF